MRGGIFLLPVQPTLVLAFNFPPLGGGISRMMGDLTRRYPPGSVVVSTGAYPGSVASDAGFAQTIDRVSVPADRLRTIQGLARWTVRATRLARRHQPRFAWCAELKPAGYPARWLHRRFGVPYGFATHGAELLLLDEKIRRSRFKRRTALQLLEGASVFVANSRWTGAYTQRLLVESGLPGHAERVRVVPLGTDPAHFRPGLDSSAVRAKYGLAGGPWILTVARLDWHKGLDTVIRAMPAIRSAHPTARYAIAGVGSAGEWLQRVVAEAGVGDCVRFLGFVPDQDLPALYNAADLFVLASRRHDLLVEGFGIAVVEASACGRAVLGAREAGVPDAVREGETGLLVSPYDPAAWAAEINRLLGDDALRTRLGAAGRGAVETYYNWGRVTREYIAIEEEFAR